MGVPEGITPVVIEDISSISTEKIGWPGSILLRKMLTWWKSIRVMPLVTPPVKIYTLPLIMVMKIAIPAEY